LNYYERIRYDAATGVFTWAVSAPGITVGKVAGSLTVAGYWVIKLGRESHRAHRLAWFLAHGEWPAGEVDHINGVRCDNRLQNLRVVDRAGNSQNRRVAQSNSKSGLLGVCWVPHARRWRAQIMANKVMHRLGYFSTPQDAHAAYLAAKSSLHIQGG
jgi:HNH endonuclease